MKYKINQKLKKNLLRWKCVNIWGKKDKCKSFRFFKITLNSIFYTANLKTKDKL
jgi:hypothetical protein